MDKHLVKIIKDISIETGIPIYKVELIVMSEFQFLRNTIQKGDFKSVRLMHLGRFKVSEFHKKNGRKKNSKDTI